MSIDHIRQSILAQAKADADGIEAEARARRDKKLAAARKALEAEFARRTERARQDAQQESLRRKIRREGEHNLALLKRRNEILDDLFSRAAHHLTELPDDEYRAVMEKWMQELPGDTPGQMLCNERDMQRLAPAVKKLNASRPQNAQIQQARHEAPLLGGALFRAERFEIDLSVDARWRQSRQSLAPEVSRIVFPGDMTV